MENQTIVETAEIKYAGFGKRFAAMIIDQVLITFFCSSLYWELQRGLLWSVKRMNKRKSLDDFDMGISNIYDKAESMAMNYYIIFMIIVVWCYFAGMESSPWRGTIGKKILGLEVSDEEGNRVSFIKASGRHFAKIISGLILYIGYLAMLFNNTKQTWHDKLSGCIMKEK